MCSSFVKHWNTKDGERRAKCAPVTVRAQDVADVYEGFDIKIQSDAVVEDTEDLVMDDVTGGVTNLSDDEIWNEVMRRKLLTEDYLMDAETEDLVAVGVRRDLGFVRGAMPAKLIHELRRQECGGGGYEEYYDDPTRPGVPNARDKVACMIFERKCDVNPYKRVTRSVQKAIEAGEEKNNWTDGKKVGPVALY
jgi:hypothetical protein